MSASHALVTASTFSDSVGKLGQVIAAVVVFFAALLLIFFLAGRATGRFQRPLTVAIFVGPAIVLLLIGLVIPSFRTFYLSLHGAQALHAPYVGFKNYGFAFTDPATQSVLLNTLLWIIVAPIVATGLGLLDRDRRRPDEASVAREVTDLHADGDLVRRGQHHLEVRLRLQGVVATARRPAEPGRHLPRLETSAQLAAHSSAE